MQIRVTVLGEGRFEVTDGQSELVVAPMYKRSQATRYYAVWYSGDEVADDNAIQTFSDLDGEVATRNAVGHAVLYLKNSD